MIAKNLKTDIENYCSVNNIEDVTAFINKMLQQGFTSEKYGSTPFKSEPKEIIVEKEVIVEKEIYISNDDNLVLTKKITKLEEDMKIKDKLIIDLKSELASKDNNDIYNEKPRPRGTYGSNIKD